MTTQTEALKPCPFCGGEAELIIDNEHHGEFFQLGCKDKECLGHWAYYTESIAETPVSEAIAHWNTRALAQQSNEQVEPVGALLLGGVFQTSEGFEFEEWDIEWNHKAVEALQEKFVTNEPVTLSLYTHPPVPTAQPKQEPNKDGSPCPEFWDWLPKAYNFEGDGNFTKYNMEVAFLAGKQAAQPKEPEQEPVAYLVTGPYEKMAFSDIGSANAYCRGLNKGFDTDAYLVSPLYTTPPQRKPLTDEHPLMVFAKECALGAYQEHELADAANKAIEAADRIIKENT